LLFTKYQKRVMFIVKVTTGVEGAVKLRSKTLLSVGMVILILFTILIGFSRYFLLGQVNKYEVLRLEENVKRAVATVEEEIEELDGTVTNYSAWDDTVAFINSHNYREDNQYLTNNYTDETYQYNHVNLIVMSNKEGKFVYQKMYDFSTMEQAPLPKSIEVSLSKLGSLYSFSSPKDHKAGIVQINNQPVLISARPIVSSKADGPIVGTLIFGRFVDQYLMNDLFEITNFEFTISVGDNQGASANDVTINVLNDDQVEGTKTLSDINKNPIFQVSVTMNRDMYQYADSALETFFIVMFLSYVVLAFCCLVLLNRTITSRLIRLRNQLLQIKSTNEISTVIQASGPDEIGDLEIEFNDLLRRLESSYTRLKEQALNDPLTNLPNRIMFHEKLDAAIKDARSHHHKVAVMFIDLDRFKFINDTLGHDVGDSLLIMVSERLKEADYTNTAIISRLGGDEFTVILPYLTEVHDLMPLLELMISTLSRPYQIGEHNIRVTASIGVSIFPNDGEEIDTIIKCADMAMYKAKQEGKNNFQFYNVAIEEIIAKRMKLETYLRKAVEEEQFSLQYQPKVNIHTGNVVGMEALIRWEHPLIGFIPPSEFIPLAEDTGLIIPIGEWVLRTACSDNKKWQEAGYEPLVVAVNLSAHQFQQPFFVEYIKDVLHETKLDPQYLELEITESFALHQIDTAIKKLKELKRMGVKISIDDFGTGYSSLSYLKKFPIDTLKIDKSFVDDILNESDDAAIATAIVSLAQSLNLNVVAEGVETEDQLNFLKKLGCNDMQGFLYSRPLAKEKFEEFLVNLKRH